MSLLPVSDQGVIVNELGVTVGSDKILAVCSSNKIFANSPFCTGNDHSMLDLESVTGDKILHLYRW